MKKIDLTMLPRKPHHAKEVIDWENSIGFRCNFVYESQDGYVEIIDYVKKGSRIYFKYDNEIYDMFSSHFIKCCFGKILNNITIKAPWMVKYFQGGIDEAKKYTHGSNYEIYPICPDCGDVKSKKIKIKQIYAQKSIGCSCGGKISYPEKFMYNFLTQLGVAFIYRVSKNELCWCRNYQYDFYLKDYNTIIETHGEQHYKESGWRKSLETEQENDQFKMNTALMNGVYSYVVIDCRKSEPYWIKSNILESELSHIFDLSSISWTECDGFALSNFIKNVCDYYENNKDLNQIEISKKFKVCGDTISKYLRQGEKLGWCSNVKERSKNARSESISIMNTKLKSKKVFCIELNEEFESANKCATQLSDRFNKNFYQSNISAVCRGNTNKYNGFKFKYVN